MNNQNSSKPSLKNVTFSGNSAAEGGGMLNAYDTVPTLTNVTFSENSANTKGGGMYNYYSSPIVRNSILWGNTAPTGSQLHNESSTPVILYSDLQGGCPAGNTCSNVISADPLLGDLGNYGGSTQVLPLLPGSAAIDAGDNADCPAQDQRGASRPLDGNGDGTATCDMGAYEVVNTPPTVALSNTSTSLLETTDTSSAIKVADIIVIDDGFGANVLSLSGADAIFFSIVGASLYLNAGATLNATANPTLDVTVSVDDASIGGTPDDSKPLSIAVINVDTHLEQNSSFETYTRKSRIPTKWVASKNFSLTDGKSKTRKSGKYSVMIAGAGTAKKTLTQTLTGITGLGTDVLTFSFWVKGKAVPAPGKCMGQVMLYSGTKLVLTKTLSCPKGTFGFKPLKTTFNAPGAYNKVVIRFTYQKASGSVWFDLVSLTR
jgi:predicted outer membrane repeat protein